MVVKLISKVFLILALGFVLPPSASGLADEMPMASDYSNDVLPFGNNLFEGAFSSKYEQGVNPDYVITEGDRILIRIWGAKTFEDVLTVDTQGNIFIPEVGPVAVLGVKNKDLNAVVREQVGRVFSNNIDIYTNLLGVQPIGVFVTGYVQKPGRYAGNMVDSVLYYIDQAGGILEPSGSYRRIELLRDGKIIANIDLYAFLLDGFLPHLQLKDGDTILIKESINKIHITGTVNDPAIYEFVHESVKGKEVVDLAKILPVTSHVLIQGVRDNQPISWYVSISEFEEFSLLNGDRITFYEDIKANTITIRITGAHEGPSAMAVKKDAKLLEVLSYVKVDKNIVDFDSIYIKRERVARKQKEALERSLRQLEKSVLTASSASADEAVIRKNEAELVLAFAEKAKQLKPEGRVVVMSDGKINNISLENNDEIFIQQKSDVVSINGEVLLPQAIIHKPSSTAEYYIRLAGGYSDRADKSKVVVIRTNGQTEVGRSVAISPGDEILVLAKTEVKSLQLAKDITQILYQIAIATKVAIGF